MDEKEIMEEIEKFDITNIELRYRLESYMSF